MAKLKPPVNSEDHIEGSFQAPVIFTEYGDFQCPYCGAAYPVIKQIQKKFGDQLGFVFRHFPLTEAHPYAQIAAVASEAADLQGKFWPMHDLIYENQTRLSPKALLTMAESLKMDLKKFQKDIEDAALVEKVETSFESGIDSGVNGTPSFYINGVKYEGYYDLAPLSHAIEKALAGHKEISRH
jgi:protein-disulfide isomerase